MKDNLSCFEGVCKTLEWMPIIGLNTLKDLIELELKKRYSDWEQTTPNAAVGNVQEKVTSGVKLTVLKGGLK